MVIAYIKEEKKTKKFLKGIKIKSFDNNYIIDILDKSKKRIIKKLAKCILKLKIDIIVFSKELEGELKNKICEMLGDRIQTSSGKILMQYMDYEIIKYILEKQKKNVKQEDIYIIFKKDLNLNLNFLKRFIENFRMTNVVTNDITRLKNVQENLIETDNILISVSNNKRKALKRAKYIINVNLTKEELEKYRINRLAIIINLKETVKYSVPSFEGINVNHIRIKCPDDIIEKFEQIGNNFDEVELYESLLLKQNFNKLSVEKIQEKIKNDDIKIIGLEGNNGEISEQEIKKISEPYSHLTKQQPINVTTV